MVRNTLFAGVRGAAAACVMTLVVSLAAVAAALPAAAQQVVQQDISIDGAPVTVTVQAGESIDLSYNWDGTAQVELNVLACSPETSGGPLDFAVSIAGVSSASNCTPVHVPRDIGPRTPAQADGNVVNVLNLTDTHAIEITLALVSVPPDVTGQLVPGGDPVSVDLAPVDAADHRRAAWFTFEGTEGQRLRLEMRDCSPFAGTYRLRLPDLSSEFVSCSFSGTDWIGTLPTSGTYRFEFETNNTVVGLQMSARLEHVDLPQACQEAGVAPIALVHGFNGSVGDWSDHRPWLVDRVLNELLGGGASVEDAELCSEAFVRTVVLGPRDSSFANATVLGPELMDLRDDTGSDVVDVIVHSKGGLDARWATYFAPSTVRNIMMIATPNGGTPLADVACGLYNTPFAVAQDQIESRFGPCDGPEDALFGLTESFVQGELNRRVLDQPDIVYKTIAGEVSCIWCQVAETFMGANDGLVPGSSVRWLADMRGHTPVGTFPFEHGDLLINVGVARRAYCSLSGRNHDGDACLLEPDAPADGRADGALRDTSGQSAATMLAHFSPIEVPPGAAATATLPVGGLGPAKVAVLTDGDDVSAQAGGVDFEVEPDAAGSILTGEIASPGDVELQLSNAGAEAVESLILVFAEDAAGLRLDIPGVVDVGEPVEIRVPGVTVDGLSGWVIGPAGDRTALSFDVDGSGVMSIVEPSEPGSHAVSVVQAGSPQRVAFDGFDVADGSAEIPGSVTDSVATGPDGLGDALHLDVDVDVADGGTYVLAGAVTTADGSVVGLAESTEELGEGSGQMRLTISGPNVYATQQDGPYEVTDLSLFREQADGARSLAAHLPRADSPTGPYSSDSFRPTLVEPGFAAVEQGDFDVVVAEVPVTLSDPVTRPVTVEYESVLPSGNGYAVPGEDFEPVSGTLTFVPGETSKAIPLTIFGDPEQEEELLAAVQFTDPSNAVVAGDGEGGVRIVPELSAVIELPADGSTWAVGEEISFSGYVGHPPALLLPPSALDWQLRAVRCPTPDTCEDQVVREWDGVADGTFVAPDLPYPSYLELVLTAEKADGQTYTVVRELAPRTVEVTLDTDPPGLTTNAFAYEWTTATAPLTQTVIEGSTSLHMWATSPQTVDSTTYVFQGWSHGEPLQGVPIPGPVVDTTYTAIYESEN